MAMEQFDAKFYEETGLKAHKKGFFREWTKLSASIKESEEIPLCDAGYIAYKQLKLQGSA
tara:strand:- start:2710 stop:2889 length:180 start_codon:yes stop_codon:yes gene_type:complete